MKKIKWVHLYISIAVFSAILVNCNPKQKEPGTVIVTPPTDTTIHIRDSVLERPDMDEYSAQLNAMRKPRPPKPKPGEPPIVVTPSNGCLLLDFNGEGVSGTLWNINGDFTCAPSGLSVSNEQIVFDKVTQYYSVFNPYILITRDEAVFNSYPQNKRRRIIITSTMPEGYGGTGGVAYINSFSWFDNSPAFVNSAGLSYNAKNIADACGHEGGHTLGCRHQSEWRYNPDGSCYKYSEYFWGNKIMGASYSDPNPQWSIGPNSLGCTIIQDDTLVIFNTLRK